MYACCSALLVRDTLRVVLWCLLVCGLKIVGQGDIAVTTAEEYGAAFSDLTYSVRLLSGKQVQSSRAWAVACWAVIAQRVGLGSITMVRWRNTGGLAC